MYRQRDPSVRWDEGLGNTSAEIKNAEKDSLEWKVGEIFAEMKSGEKYSLGWTKWISIC